MRTTLTLAISCALFLGALSGRADDRTHDGFYLQVAAGLGGFKTSPDVPGPEQSYSGLTIPASLLLGGTLFKHLVIGGGFFMDTSPSPKYKLGGKEVTGTDFRQFLIGIGGFLDYYVWSDKGLHFPLFLGWGGLETSSNGNAGGSDPTGFTMYFGGGYDFFISDNWSVGGLLRLVIAPLKYNETKFTTVEPGLLVTLSYH